MITVPKSALTDSNDSGESIAPEVGDTVDLGKAQAKVVSIDGDNYCLSVNSVNGTPCADDNDDEGVEASDAAGGGDKSGDMGAILEAKAAASDKRRFGA